MEKEKVLYNKISKQEKSPTSKITPIEWNYIINTLAKQTNQNSILIEKIQIYLKNKEDIKEREVIDGGTF